MHAYARTHIHVERGGREREKTRIWEGKVLRYVGGVIGEGVVNLIVQSPNAHLYKQWHRRTI